MIRKTARWAARFLLLILVATVLLALVAAILPIPVEEVISAENSGAGSVAVKPSYSGLNREFPPSTEPVDNPKSALKEELGRQLFFDPLLSLNNDKSCATCHHPDLGFSNGEALSAGRSGRNVPTLWNIGYSQMLHWDGSEESLEAQAIIPLTHADEMGSDLNDTVNELAEIDAYATLFADVFRTEDGGEISAENILKSLAAFERSLITNSSPFDQYAAGNFEALTTQQRRGLALFRSGATRCFECHSAPTFALDKFKVIGVESDDVGRADVVADGVVGAFRVPTLRNIALTAPYMHNGSMASLEEVVQFYVDGGGRQFDTENIDPFVAGFEASELEKADLVAFLHALTDESGMPDIPDLALSGLDAVNRIDNPAREVSAEFNSAAVGGEAAEPRDPLTISINAGQSVQEAIDLAQPGDTIEIAYGTYKERVAIDITGITILGVPNASGDYPIFDGGDTLSEAFIASGNDFAIGQLHIRNYTDNGILVEGADNVHIYDIVSENTGTYGIYPTKSTGVLVERVKASGVNDAAIYAGQCRDVVIRDSEVFDSVIGIELENTINGEAYNNVAYNNSLGIFVVVLPQLNSKVSRDTKVYNNTLYDNNLDNFADEGMAAALVPPGVGVLSLGGDNVEIYANEINDHRTTGVAIFSLTSAYDANEIDVGPNPENNWVHDNNYDNNGYDPVEFVRNLGIPVGDILWDGSGWGNRFDEPEANPGFPVILPSDSWPEPIRKIHWRALDLIIKLVG